MGSSVKRDFCGVCGGKNASCQRLAAVAYPTELLVKARNPQRRNVTRGNNIKMFQTIKKKHTFLRLYFIFIVTETYGYSPVVRIPKGATHVRVTDNSTNYIGSKKT